MSIAAFLVAMVGPLVARLLTALGVSLVTVTGLVAAAAALKSAVLSGIGGLPAAAVQLGGLFGLWQALGIILGAVTFVLAYRATSGFIMLAKA